MNQIHYFRNESTFIAIAPGQFLETITHLHFANKRYPLFSSISLSSGKYHKVEFYEVVENNYVPSDYHEYTEARRKAQAATIEFFGEYQQFQAPPVEVDSSLPGGISVIGSKRPTHIDRPNAHHLINDLPF